MMLEYMVAMVVAKNNAGGKIWEKIMMRLSLLTTWDSE